MEAFRVFPFEAVGKLATALIREAYESMPPTPAS